MFKFVVFACVVAFVNASGYLHSAPVLHAPVAHTVAVQKVHAVPTVVGYDSKIVGEKVVGYNTHNQVHHVPKVITQQHVVLKPATWQQSSGHSVPATGKVISAPIPVVHHAPVLAHASYGHGLDAGHGAY